MSVYSLQNQGSTTPNGGNIIDIGDINMPLIPPIMLLTQTGNNTTKIEGSHDATNWVDFSNGGYTTSVAKSLVLGIRYWRANVSGWVSGAVTASVGAVPVQGGRYVMPHLLTVTTSVTQGA